MGHQTADYPPRIVIKFHGLQDESAALQYDYHLYLTNEEFTQFKSTFPNLKIERLFISVKPEYILKLAHDFQARQLDSTRPVSFLTYFSTVCPEGVNPREVTKLLTQFPSVEKAYIAAVPVTAAVTKPADNPGWSKGETAFLRQAPDGIDVEYAWEIENTLGIAGGDGGGAAAGLTFVDIEHGWMIADGGRNFSKNHDDITKVISIDGDNRGLFDHGTACLGIVIASDQEPSTPAFQGSSLGITPNVKTVSCVSTFRNQADTTPNLYDAILCAVTYKLSPGDVLLLEVYFEYYEDLAGNKYYGIPIEIDDDLYSLIEVGTNTGIVIIEPAGNTDRDNDLDRLNIPQLQRNSGVDSGAIMVSAAGSPVPFPGITQNAPIKDSTGSYRIHSYGSRIDCFAWGNSIYTTYDNPPYAYFADTSGAATIIAGAALSVQGLAKLNLAGPYEPKTLREILRNPDPCTGGGTLSLDPSNDKIGVMPNLQNIIRKKLRLVPDVYARDFVGDVGDCHSGPLSVSPDIILRRTTVPNPQATFGQGSGTENEVALSDTAIVGQPHSIYVRVRNRGPIDASNVQADVYWSEVSTLPNPSNWQLIGSVTIPTVPAGNVLTVSPKLIWAAAPAVGHYCFIAVLGTTADPPPPKKDFLTQSNFERFVREENNVTWRNFDVVDSTQAAGQEMALQFLIEGPQDRARAMRLEIVSELPRGSEVKLVIPKDGFRLIQGLGHFMPVSNNDGEPKVSTPVNPHGRSETHYTEFPPETRMKSTVLVKLPEDSIKYFYELYVRQLYQDREIGRVTWRLQPKR